MKLCVIKCLSHIHLRTFTQRQVPTKDHRLFFWILSSTGNLATVEGNWQRQKSESNCCHSVKLSMYQARGVSGLEKCQGDSRGEGVRSILKDPCEHVCRGMLKIFANPDKQKCKRSSLHWHLKDLFQSRFGFVLS